MGFLKVSKDIDNILAGAVIRECHRKLFETHFPGIQLEPIEESLVFKPWVCVVSDFLNRDDDSIAGYVPNGDPIYR